MAGRESGGSVAEAARGVARDASRAARRFDCRWRSKLAGDGKRNWGKEFGVRPGLRGKNRGREGTLPAEKKRRASVSNGLIFISHLDKSFARGPRWRKARFDGFEALVHFFNQMLQFIQALEHHIGVAGLL